MNLTIGKFAKKFRLSRSTLLYYDRIGLIGSSGRTKSGYRVYNERDVKMMEKICEYRDVGLSLEDIGAIIHTKEASLRTILEKRFVELGKEIRLLKSQQSVLAALIQTISTKKQKQKRKMNKDLWIKLFQQAGMDEGSVQKWHQAFELNAPDRHQQFLLSLGFSEKEAIFIRKGGLNMSDCENFLPYFYEIFEGLHKLGPGNDQSVKKALEYMKKHMGKISHVLDLGCGTGAQSLVIAKMTRAKIVALDNHAPFLQTLQKRAEELGVQKYIEPTVGSMLDMHYPDHSFDVIWAEGSIAMMGFENGLKTLKRMLKLKGMMVVSEVGWTSENPPKEAKELWQGEYQDMKTAQKNREIIKDCGYRIVDVMPSSIDDWESYYKPLEERLNKMKNKYASNPTALGVIEGMEKEIIIYRKYPDAVVNEIYVLGL